MIKKKKHSPEFKLHCVQQMLEQYRSAKSLSQEYGITYSLFEDWLRVYEHQGASGLLPRNGKRVFSPSFKLSVLTAIREEKLSLREAVLRFELSSDAGILEWQKRFDKFGLPGLDRRPKGRLPMANKENQANKRKPRKSDKLLTREEELLRENEYLRAENALLKKLQALVQTENKRKP